VAGTNLLLALLEAVFQTVSRVVYSRVMPVCHNKEACCSFMICQGLILILKFRRKCGIFRTSMVPVFSLTCT
jgi:hypothetical protein